MEDIILVIGARGGIGRVRLRHRHEDFQSDLYFSNLIKSVTYALPISICASK